METRSNLETFGYLKTELTKEETSEGRRSAKHCYNIWL